MTTVVGDRKSSEEYFVSVFPHRCNVSGCKSPVAWRKLDQNTEKSKVYVLYHLNNGNFYSMNFLNNTVYLF